MAYLRPDTSQSLLIPSLYDPLPLDALVCPPTNGKGVYFVITHPFVPMGGNMNNSVVYKVHEWASGENWTVF
jgi:alpha/beta superfamily hydrolase